MTALPLSSTLAFGLGPVHFDSPLWLVLIPVLAPLFVLIARRSLSGLGGATAITALVVRLLVLTLFVAAMAEPTLRRQSEDVAVTAILDASRSVPLPLQESADAYLADAVEAGKGDTDRFGVVTVARDAFVQTLPTRLGRLVDRQSLGDDNATDLAAAVRLAMAVTPEDAAARFVLASDGNETAGSLLEAASAAAAANIPIDVLPLLYDFSEGEVILENLVTPTSVRTGQTMNVRVVLRATRPTSGRVTVLLNDEPVDLDPDSDGVGFRVNLVAGANPLVIPIQPLGQRAQRLRAIFEPDRAADGSLVGDAVPENNQGLAVTFVQGEGRVLLIADGAIEAGSMLEALTEANLGVTTINAEQAPTSLDEWNSYDAVVMLNQQNYGFSEAQQEQLRQYIHDTGGGFIMVGGPDAFGAGGWIGSPLEDVLPVQLDPPQKRQIPRGALALIIHSVEAPQGVFYGKQVSKAAVGALSRLDYIGIIEFEWGAGTDWVLPMQPVGDGIAANQAINNLTFGDMQDMAPSVTLGLRGLQAIDAGQRHMIIISDGDPTLPGPSIIQDFIDSNITISTVGVYPHSRADTTRFARLATQTGGNNYFVNTQAALARLPQIFVKEAQTIRRSLIWEGEPFAPSITPAASEPMRGIAAVPPISGYVVTAEREGLALVTMRGKENDPVAAQWQHGLGKVVAFTSDATSRWAPSWTAWGDFRKFWEQHVRWAMRPGGSADVRVQTETRGDETLLLVDMLSPAGERINFARFRGRVATPSGEGLDVELRQIAPGKYQGSFPTIEPGAYIAGLVYDAPNPDAAEGQEAPRLEGSVQAAVTRPFADEYRALESNLALLRQVAESTGGRVLNENPQTAELWRTEGIDFPTASRPIWLAVALAAIALFLADVAVRRVRIDPRGIVAWTAGLFRPRESKAGEQLDALAAARAKARAGMDAQGQVGAAAEKLERQAIKDAQRTQSQMAKRKFDIDDKELFARMGKSEGPLTTPTPDQPKKPKPKPQTPAADEEAGMSRLMKAKKRAQEEMDND
ncbi:MAG: glutamine amidotransferase [Planctomycetota bacterium]